MKTSWNLGLLYKNHNDPHIEKDVRSIERAYENFKRMYRGKTDYLKDEKKLFQALSDYQNLFRNLPITKTLNYFNYVLDLDSTDSVARAKATKFLERFAKNEHNIVFFELSLAKIPKNIQKKFLKSKTLAPFSYFLEMVFKRSQYDLSEPEEKILGLKSIPAREQWISMTEKILGKTMIDFADKKIPLSEATQRIFDLPTKERRELHKRTMESLKGLSEIAESEINAIVTDKKITDELRGYKTPYDQTLIQYQNDTKSVGALVKAVTDNFSISHRFYKLKAKLLGLPSLEYSDRAVGIGKNIRPFNFKEAVSTLQNTFGALDLRFKKILDEYLEKRQIDVFPKEGKTGGAYCSSNMNAPTFVLLNYTDTWDSAMTFAHEMGHAIHTEFSKSQPALYENYSISTAETASTLFEAFVFDAMFETLSHEEKIVALHKKINDDIQTIFRQIACFNFEVELHNTIREKGGMSKEEIATLMNKHMGAYLGPTVSMHERDGYSFVYWSHIRRFFYVYTYAFGQLVSKALHEKYKEDPAYLKEIKKFLNAGGNDTPERIFKSIGIDVTKPDFWKKGLKKIEEDIVTLEKLTQKR